MVQPKNKPPISPDIKVGELLDFYPELESTLIGIAPAFKKLRNPVLRRTVAKLTSLRQAARVGGISVSHMINTLRAAAGSDEKWTGEGDMGDGDQPRPSWVDSNTILEIFDARETIEAGEHPLTRVQIALDRLSPNQSYVVVTPFVPAPMIDKAKAKGFLSWTEQTQPGVFKTHFCLQD